MTEVKMCRKFSGNAIHSCREVDLNGRKVEADGEELIDGLERPESDSNAASSARSRILYQQEEEENAFPLICDVVLYRFFHLELSQWKIPIL